jgi:general secretion pathway protein D
MLCSKEYFLKKLLAYTAALCLVVGAFSLTAQDSVQKEAPQQIDQMAAPVKTEPAPAPAEKKAEPAPQPAPVVQPAAQPIRRPPIIPPTRKAETGGESAPNGKLPDSQLDKLATESDKESETETPEKDKSDKKGKNAEDADKLAKDDKKKAKKDKGKDSYFRPDFRDQEIQDVLKIFSKIIGKNIIADEKVKGKITVISPYKIPSSLAYPYLYSMLSIKGFGIVEENENLIRVVAIKDALAGSPLIFLGRDEIKDIEVKSDVAVTQILPVYGSKPSRLAAILKRLTSANTDLIDYDDISMLIITGSLFEVNRLIRISNLIDYQGPPPECDEKKDPDCGRVRVDGSVHVYRLENMQAENIEATLKKVQLPVEPLPSAPAASGQSNAPAVTQANVQKKPIDVIAHKETNSIIYVGTNDEFELVKSLIKRIDLQRQQVFLEVLIVEVGVDKNNLFGIDWIFGKGGSAQFNGGVALKSGLIDTTSGTFKKGALNQNSGFSITFLNDSVANIIGILNAQVGKSNFVVVSAPQVLTLDNQEAEINVGQDVPVQVNTFTNVTGTQSNSFEYRPVGIKLKFTPQVNKNRMVTINLFQEVKSLIPSSNPAANPIIAKKDIKTFVRVQDGQTIVIGGLVSNDRTATISKVPILGDLPLVGWIFRRTETISKRRNLMVFITPHILTNRAIADKVTEDLHQDQIKEYSRNSID